LVAIPLRIDTSAVLLPVKTHRLRGDNPGLPAGTEILVKEFNPVALPQSFTASTDDLMLLIAGIEEG